MMWELRYGGFCGGCIFNQKMCIFLIEFCEFYFQFQGTSISCWSKELKTHWNGYVHRLSISVTWFKAYVIAVLPQPKNNHNSTVTTPVLSAKDQGILTAAQIA